MQALDDAYIGWKQWDDGAFGRFTPLEATYFAAETGIEQRAATRVLEIGFGNGAFLGWAASVGSELRGVEINPHLVTRARGQFPDGRFVDSLDEALFDAERHTFTHIVAFDVIEHVPAPQLPALFRRLRELLSEGGVIVLRFPNGDSPFGRYTQHGDPTHVTTIGREKLAFYATGAGLAVRAIRAPALPLAGVGPVRALRRLGVRVVRAVIERGVSVLYFGGQRITLDPNYVAVLGHAR